MAEGETPETPPETEAEEPEVAGEAEAAPAAAAPEPQAEPAPAPTPEPQTEAAAEPAPEPTPEPQTEAAAEPAPEPVEVLSPKERRRRARGAKAAAVLAREPRTPEQRHAERQAERARKREVRRRIRVRLREKARGERAARREAATAVEQPPARDREPGRQKTRQGVVVSDKAAKTITVRIDTARRHRRYEKIVRTSRTIHAHDERGEARTGDTVIVRECRPLSRTKRWRLERILERAA